MINIERIQLLKEHNVQKIITRDFKGMLREEGVQENRIKKICKEFRYYKNFPEPTGRVYYTDKFIETATVDELLIAFDQHEKVEEKEEIWPITNEYLHAGIMLISYAMMGEKFTTKEALEERINYVLRQHCPILYGWIHTQAPNTTEIMNVIIDQVGSIITINDN